MAARADDNTISPEFDRLRRGEPRPDLTRIALEIARDAESNLEIESYLKRIDLLGSRVRERVGPNANATVRRTLGQINWVLYVEEGYRGNTSEYYDPRNSYLNEVMDRKTGIPISLAVLYAAVAERSGLAVAGVNLPAHFMLRAGAEEGPVYIDAFHEGELLDERGCRRKIAELVGEPVELSDEQLAPCRTEQVVTRMLRNLKGTYLRSGDLISALPVQRRLTALRLDDPIEQRDLGMLCVQLDMPAEALEPLASYLTLSPHADDRNAVEQFLRKAQREVAMWN